MHSFLFTVLRLSDCGCLAVDGPSILPHPQARNMAAAGAERMNEPQDGEGCSELLSSEPAKAATHMTSLQLWLPVQGQESYKIQHRGGRGS